MREKVERLFTVLCFGFMLFGGAIGLAYIYEKANCVDALSLRFIDQILMYIGAVVFTLILFYVDLLPSKLSQGTKMTISLAVLYTASLIYFSNTAVKPFQDVVAFVVYTIWFVGLTLIIGVGWFLYQMIIGYQYNKKLVEFQASIEQ